MNSKSNGRINISVIIPVYNTEKYISECLDSVISQNKIDVEIICIDDGSIDGSLDVLKEYECKYDNLTVISQKHLGQSIARNKGIELAKGEYISFLDSDDMYKNNALHKLYTCASANELDLLSFDTELIYEDYRLKDKQDEYYKRRENYCGIYDGKTLLCQFVNNKEYIDSAGLLLIKKELLSVYYISFYPGIYYEDSLFCLECFVHAKRVMHESTTAYIYRIRTNSTMTALPTIYNVRSKIIVFVETLKLFFKLENDTKDFNEVIIKILNQMVEGIRYYEKRRVDKDKDKDILEVIETEDLFLKVFQIGEKSDNNRVLLSGLDHEIISSEGVIIYGIGEIGEYVYKYLRLKKLDGFIKGYAVTSIMDEPIMKHGKQVRNIVYFKNAENLILISAGKKNSREMEQYLKTNNMNNYIHIYGDVLMAIKDYLRNVAYD